MSHFFASLNGEDLTPEQVEQRRVLIEQLVAYHMTHQQCCVRQPDWHNRIHTMKLKALKRKYKELFGWELYK